MIGQLASAFRSLFPTSSSDFVPILDASNGGQAEFDAAFRSNEETVVLGEGEFGVVTLVQERPVEEQQQREQPQERQEQDKEEGGTQNTAHDDDSHTQDTINNAQSMVQEQEHQQQSPETLSLYACKTLHKGVVFKNNVLYAPLSPQILQTEVDCLRALQGRHSCLRLHAIYETQKTILIVTELCTGGDVLEYRTQTLQQQSPSKHLLPMRTLSSLAYQLLDAVRHCFANGIIHRDVKCQNCLVEGINNDNGDDNKYKHPIRLTLIDFGTSALHKDFHLHQGENKKDDLQDLPTHTTYAGSAFYQSPEMFQNTYNQRTDVWSAGMVLFVAAFGYPQEAQRRRQRVFDALISSPSKRDLQPRNWQTLMELSSSPRDDNAHDSLQLPPQGFLDLLNDCLTYRHKRRPNAKDLLESHADFWQWLLQDDNMDGPSNNQPPPHSQSSTAANFELNTAKVGEGEESVDAATTRTTITTQTPAEARQDTSTAPTSSGNGNQGEATADPSSLSQSLSTSETEEEPSIGNL